MKMAAIYTRVSSEKQTENQSLDVQRTDCRQLAEREGYEVYAEYEDGGYTGTNMNRPGMQELLSAAEAHRFDAIIVWDQSRFGRDFIDVELNLRRLERLGIEFRAVHGPSGDDESAKLTRRILAAVYENELDVAKRRKKAGRRMKVEAGRGWPGGQIPYGYISENFRGPDGKLNTKLQPHPQESQIVQQIFDLYAHQNYSAHDVAKYLNAKGIKTRHGRQWWITQIKHMLANETYAGRAYYFKTAPDGQPIDPAFWLKIDVPPLVDEETFQAARAFSSVRRGTGKGPKNSVWPEADLIGLIYCECGMYMVASHQRGVAVVRNYYKCASGHTLQYADKMCSRKPTHVRMEPIDEAVWQALLAEMDDGERLERKFLEYHQNLEIKQSAELESSERIRLDLDRLSKRETEAWDIYDSGDEDWDKETLKRRLAALREKRESLERRLKEVSASERTATNLKQTAREIRRLADDYRDRLHNLPREKRREVLQLLVSRVTLHGDNSLAIEWRFPAASIKGSDGSDIMFSLAYPADTNANGSSAH